MIFHLLDSVLAGSAKQAGLKKGDVLNSVNGEVFYGRQEFVSFFQKNEGRDVFWVSLEMKKQKNKTFLPAKNPSGNVVIGVSVKLPEEKRINHSYLSAVPSALNKTKRDRKLYWSIWVAF